MPLLGTAVVAIWNGIKPAARADFYEWHSREHMLERVGIPGFLRGRRLIAEKGHPEWFTLYEVEDPRVLAGADYLARLNAPTDWTKRVVPSFTDVTRSLCRTTFTTGPGVGGSMATIRCDAAAGRSAELAGYFEKVLSKSGGAASRSRRAPVPGRGRRELDRDGGTKGSLRRRSGGRIRRDDRGIHS